MIAKVHHEAVSPARHFSGFKKMSLALIALPRPVAQSTKRVAATCCCFSTTQAFCEIRNLARMRIVDNSAIGKAAAEIGKPPRVINVYNKKNVGYLGDKVLVTVKGEMRRAYIVGLRQKQKPNVPRMDTNNIVLVDDNGNPLGNRIHVPVPSCLKGKGGDLTKILSLATKFV
ncbi:39S ribosomal protein l14, mitochondrial [Plakobranchus ocellatus]|uniref:Large ribosomal subunit protein uL14m n=1 Tax=Plakobranchus ocellatus TaxID=259542 RepID=A0AAV4ACZ2_9GAST|nr:39S ribosomal protein l14, mitochondrial [Plakobranchus ocellatus]